MLWGALDPVLPISTGESVVRDLGADCVMVTVPGVGHFVLEEATEVVATVLLDFLADETTPRPPVAAAPPQQPEPGGAAARPAAGRRPGRGGPGGSRRWELRSGDAADRA